MTLVRRCLVVALVALAPVAACSKKAENAPPPAPEAKGVAAPAPAPAAPAPAPPGVEITGQINGIVYEVQLPPGSKVEDFNKNGWSAASEKAIHRFTFDQSSDVPASDAAADQYYGAPTKRVRSEAGKDSYYNIELDSTDAKAVGEAKVTYVVRSGGKVIECRASVVKGSDDTVLDWTKETDRLLAYCQTVKVIGEAE